MARPAFRYSANECYMQCSVFTYPPQFMFTWDGAEHIFLVRQRAPLLQSGRGSLQDCSLSSFHLEQELKMAYHHCKLIASGVARLQGELLLVQQSYSGDPRPYWGLPGGQVEPGEELLAGLQ